MGRSMCKTGRKSTACCPSRYMECEMLPVRLSQYPLGSKLALHGACISITGPASCPSARRIPGSPAVVYLIIIAEGEYRNLGFIILKQREEEQLSGDLFASFF